MNICISYIKNESYIDVRRASFRETKCIKMANFPFTILTYNTERKSEDGRNSDRVKNTYNALISCFSNGLKRKSEN
jgi:hypothetical protein